MSTRTAVLALGLCVTACGTEPIRAAPGTTTGAGGGTAASQVTALTDPQSAAVLASLNNGEIGVAQAVMARLTQQDIFDFGQVMITEHTGANLQAMTLLTQQGITPGPSALSQAIDRSAQEVMNQLQPLNDLQLNQAYIDSQVLMHQQALAIVDCVVLPSLQNAALRGFVTGTVRPAVAMHLTLATAISASTNSGQAAVGSIDGGTGTVAASDCSMACTALSSGGLLTDPLRTAACTAP